MNAEVIARFEQYVDEMLDGNKDTCILELVRQTCVEYQIEMTKALDVIINLVDQRRHM